MNPCRSQQIRRREFLKDAALSAGGVAIGGALAKAHSMTPRQRVYDNSVIVSTTSPMAIKTGLGVLKHGGSAADAVITTALLQITKCAGCWVSFAGRMTCVYFDAKSGETHVLNACYDAPRNELDPMSIPRQPNASGRTVLVPGFMAGIGALHARFGRIEWKRLFEPSIQLAGEGFELDSQLASLIRNREQILTRLEETRREFSDADGNLIKAGERFVQNNLAITLKRLAVNGWEEMYRGEWADKFVQAVKEEGGKLVHKDLYEYKPTWSKALRTDIGRGVTVFGLPSPNLGCPIALACLTLATHAKISELGHFTESAESLRRMLLIESAIPILATPIGQNILSKSLQLADLKIDNFSESEIGSRLWKLLDSSGWNAVRQQFDSPTLKVGDHSDAIVAIDSDGNAAAVLHTINTAGWGTTGLFVDGVSIPDSASFQQSAVANAGPGGRITDFGPPLIAVKDGRTILAGSATGGGNVNVSWQNFSNILLNGMSPQLSVSTPNFHNGRFERSKATIHIAELVEANATTLKMIERFRPGELGYWVGASQKNEPRILQGVKVNRLDGIVAGF